MRASSRWNQATVSPGLGTLFCLRPRGVGCIHRRSPTRDQAMSVALPSAIRRASGFRLSELGPGGKKMWKCMSAM
jgi:hypothetical protein